MSRQTDVDAIAADIFVRLADFNYQQDRTPTGGLATDPISLATAAFNYAEAFTGARYARMEQSPTQDQENAE